MASSITKIFRLPSVSFDPKSRAIIFRNSVRTVSYDKLSNKRITRLESDIELDSSENFRNRLINRNPRNLEQLSRDIKPEGFWLDKNPVWNWNNLVFEQKGRYLYTSLVHWSGRTIIEASTREQKLAKYFKNPSTTQAAMVLAQVMARRCLQSGYITVGQDIDESEQLAPKTKAFYECVEANGITLKEPPAIKPRCVTDL